MKDLTASTVDEYIASFPEETQYLLDQIRAAIRKAAPRAAERISYGMPAYKLDNKPVVYFAAFKKHIGFYATPAGHAAFANELSKYKQGKGSVQFPFGRPLPLTLIERITKYKVKKISGD